MNVNVKTPSSRLREEGAGGGESGAALAAADLAHQLLSLMLKSLAPKVSGADHAFGIDHIDRRPTANIPRRSQWATRSTVDGIAPGDFVFF